MALNQPQKKSEEVSVDFSNPTVLLWVGVIALFLGAMVFNALDVSEAKKAILRQSFGIAFVAGVIGGILVFVESSRPEPTVRSAEAYNGGAVTIWITGVVIAVFWFMIKVAMMSTQTEMQKLFTP